MPTILRRERCGIFSLVFIALECFIKIDHNRIDNDEYKLDFNTSLYGNIDLSSLYNLPSNKNNNNAIIPWQRLGTTHNFVRPVDIGIDKYIKMRKAYTKYMIVKKEILDKAHDLISKYDLINAIGVYFRGTDKKTEYGLTLNEAINYYHEAIEIIDHTSNEQRKLYIQSDEENFYKKMEEKYPGRTIRLPFSTSVNGQGIHHNPHNQNKESAIDAILIMLCLSSTKHLICCTCNLSYVAVVNRGNLLKEVTYIEDIKARQYHSQFGQDRAVEKFFKRKMGGYFIDIGAYDGKNFSNTYTLETLYGWNGICIEPLPNEFIFCNARRRAKCYNYAVYNENDKILLFTNAGMLSGITTNIDRYKQILNNEQIEVKTKTMNYILEDAHAPLYIDYMSLDTEGSEFEIIKNIDFSKYTIGYIDIEHNFIEPRRTQIRNFLLSKGYIYKGENIVDDIYIHKSMY